MSLRQAKDDAVAIAAQKLAGVDLRARCELLGLPAPENDRLRIHAFGRDMVLDTITWDLAAEDGSGVHPDERVLVLQYLACTQRLHDGGELVAFRQFPGGRFYEGPFKARTSSMLDRVVGNHIERLRRGLGKFDWTPMALGDFGARIHTVGILYLTLVYRLGDNEFPPSSDILFDSCALKVLTADSAGVLAGRICAQLVKG